MAPNLKFRQAEPRFEDDPIPFPDRFARQGNHWEPRLTRPDDAVRGAEEALEKLDAKMRELSRLVNDNDDPDRPRAA